MDIRELLIQVRAGVSDRRIAQDLKLNRRTVKRYREWAQEQGLLEDGLPSLEALQQLKLQLNIIQCKALELLVVLVGSVKQQMEVVLI